MKKNGSDNLINDQLLVYKESDVELNTKEAKEILRDSQKKVNNQRKNSSKIINIAFFVISILVLVITLMHSGSKYGVKDIHELFNTDYKLKLLFYVLLVFLLIMILDSCRTYILLLKATGIHRPMISYKSTAICRYYDCITPFTFGGQPFQVYYLNNRGVKGGVATSVPLAKYMFNQFAFCIISLIMLIISYKTFGDQSAVVVTFSIVSLAISFVFLGFTIFLSVSKKSASKLLFWIIHILHKIRLIKKEKTAFLKTLRLIKEYQNSMKYYLKNFWVAVITFVSSLAIFVLKALIPYLIYLVLTLEPEVGFAVVFSKFVICELATMYIPLPGGAGMAELSFTALFASLFMDGSVFWALLLYRISTYYIYILQGLMVIVYDIIIGDKRDKKYMESRLVELSIRADLKKK